MSINTSHSKAYLCSQKSWGLGIFFIFEGHLWGHYCASRPRNRYLTIFQVKATTFLFRAQHTFQKCDIWVKEYNYLLSLSDHNEAILQLQLPSFVFFSRRMAFLKFIKINSLCVTDHRVDAFSCPFRFPSKYRRKIK